MTAGSVTVTPAGARDLDDTELQRLWFDVTQAGGAVGLRPPVTLEQTRPLVDELLDAARTGDRVLVAARALPPVVEVAGATPRPPTGHPELVGLVAVDLGRSPRKAHRATLRRLMVHPDRQGEGLGGRLVAGAHDVARARGAELAIVEVRDGLGLDAFYERHGYRVCGRIPRGLAFDDGDRVDELLLVADLRADGLGDDTRGDDVRGDDVRGDDVRGDDVRGDDVRGDGAPGGDRRG